jgi:hypothetical protein
MLIHLLIRKTFFLFVGRKESERYGKWHTCMLRELKLMTLIPKNISISARFPSSFFQRFRQFELRLLPGQPTDEWTAQPHAASPSCSSMMTDWRTASLVLSRSFAFDSFISFPFDPQQGAHEDERRRVVEALCLSRVVAVVALPVPWPIANSPVRN